MAESGQRRDCSKCYIEVKKTDYGRLFLGLVAIIGSVIGIFWAMLIPTAVPNVVLGALGFTAMIGCFAGMIAGCCLIDEKKIFTTKKIYIKGGN